MSRMLGPRESFGLFDSPAVVETALATGVVARVAPENADRVALILVQSGSANCTVLPDPSVTTTRGFVLSTSVPLFVPSAHYGNLAQVGWWAVSSGVGSRVTAIEVVLKRWPQR